MKYLIIFLFIATQIFAQISSITRFPLQDSTTINRYGIMVDAGDGSVLFVWSEGHVTNISRSTDSGLTWNEKSVLWDETGKNFRTVLTNSGRIILAYLSTQGLKYCWSDDNGNTWSERETLPITSSFNLSVDSNNKIWLVYSPSTSKKLVYKTSIDNGETWSGATEFWNDSNINHIAGDIVQINDSTLLSVAHVQFDSLNYIQNILTKFSFDDGNSWSQYSDIYSDNPYIETVQTVKSNKNIKIIFSRYKKYYESGVLMDFIKTVSYIESFDDGLSWSDIIPFSKTFYNDYIPTSSKIGDKIATVFASTRFSYPYQLMYGIVGESDDTDAPAMIKSISHIPGAPVEGDTLIIRAVILDETGISKAFVTPTVNGIVLENVEMFDDGLHNDLEANDNVYGISLGSFKANDAIRYFVTAIDLTNYITNSYEKSVVINNPNKMREYYFDVNRFKLPINNYGVLADLKVGDAKVSGRFDDSPVLYSGGFWLSGYVEGDFWGNGLMTAGRLVDYLPGKVGGQTNDTLNMIYILRSSDKPFGEAWQTWRTAVELGAKFYDGDGDGIYNPVDLNGNGTWDSNEDRPDLIGDVTTWTVYNDGVSAEERSFINQYPMNVEVKQTLFAYSPESYPELDGVIFIRYNIKNKNKRDFDSLYFSVNADIDIGNYADDLTGCDTTINSSYGYNDGDDDDFGSNTPAIFTTLLQGPVVYIPGETFIDNNGNGIYEQGTDTPIDTAYNFNGEFIDTEFYEGAKNQSMTSSTNYIRSVPGQGDPDNEIQMRYYQMGLLPIGEYIDPCAEYYGTVIGEDCHFINPKYFYTGDPVKRTGWLDTHPDDMRTVFHTGPFDLAANESVEILIAYSVGRGDTELESIDVTKQIVNNAISFYNTNFTYVPVGVKENITVQLPTEFYLSQNYPNPFNPSTTITYSIPVVDAYYASTTNVVLKVYDILGREVATLVKKEQKAGNYEVNFDASSLTSGVYFYRLQSGSFNKSRKMILLK